MDHVGTWRSRPVFITSTFLDMQDERDFLRNVVFPDIEEQLRARRHHLEWIDLRVGVATAAAATEEARELQVLKVCLAEVKRSRPFLIALIGDRYGWVPPEARIKAAAAEEGFEGDVAGRSVTDLEIDFGVLSDPEQRKRSYFYFREPLPYAAMGEAAACYSERFDSDPEAQKRGGKLEALKQRIKEQFPDRVRSYPAQWNGQNVTGFEKLRELVTRDLWRELEAETADALSAGEVSWRQAEREAVEDFAEDRARDFVGRKELLGRIARFASSKPGEGSWGLCVTGAAGAGKSALWGMLQARLPQAKFALVLGHAAGASQRAASVDAMLRRWIDELAADLGVPWELAEDAKDEDVEAAFASLLGRVAQRRRVLILVDALDQFEQTTQARNLTWLPRLWPENARLIATTIPSEASQALLQRAGVDEASLPPLAASEARDIIAAICQRYRRTFEPPVIDALVAKKSDSGPACSNPLWLIMAVEELNLLDADDFARVRRDYGGLPPATALCALMCDMVSGSAQSAGAAGMPADIPGLYAWSFDRAAALFGAPLTQALLGAIAVSRGGWRESDFREVLPKLASEPWDELRSAQLRRSFRGQMRQRGALSQWDFAHGQMRPAVKAWLARVKAPQEPAIHTAIANHLLALPADDPLHVSETMMHLMAERDAPARARLYYGRASLTAAETDGATRVLADLVLAAPAGDRKAALAQVLRLLDGTDVVNSRSAALVANAARRFLYDFDSLINQRIELAVEAALFDRMKTAYNRLLLFDPGNAGWQHDLSVSHLKIGDVLIAQGNLPEAQKTYRDGLAIADQLAKSDPDNADWQRDLSVSYNNIGDVLVAQGDLLEALKSYRDGRAIADRLAKSDPGNAYWQRDLSVSYTNIGDVLVAQGNLPEALKTYRDGLAIRDRLAKSDPGNARWQRDLSASYNKIGDVLVAQGNLPEALKSYRDGRAIADRLAKSDPGNAYWQRDLSVSYTNIGDVLVARGNLPEALKLFRDGLAIADRLAKSDPGNAGWQSDLSGSYNKIGDMLVAQGNLPEALKTFRDGLAIADRLAKSDPGNAGWQRDLSVSYNNIGDVLVAQGNLPEALKTLRDGLAIRDRLAKSDPGNTGWQRDLSVSYDRVGNVLVAQGDLLEALKTFRDGLAIRDRLAKSDPGHARWQRDLSVSYERIGDVLMAQGNLLEALKTFRDGLAIRDRLTKSDPGNARWQRDLSMSYDRIGDVLMAQGNLPEALKTFRDRLAIADRLAKSDPSNADWQRDLSMSCERVGDVLVTQGNLPEALKTFRDGLAIRERLAKADPSNARGQHDVIVSCVKVAEIDRSQARTLLTMAGEVVRQMEQRGQLAPQNAWMPADLARRLNELSVPRIDRPQSSPGRHGEAPVRDAAAAAPPARLTDAKVVAESATLLDRGNATGARDLLYKQGSSNSTPRNLLAVCYLRLGDPQRALDILRSMIFPDGGLLPKESAEPAWIVNFATAMVLRGDIEAGRRALRWLKDPVHPGAVRLLGAIEAWEKSPGAGGRFKRMFGGRPQKPIPLDFPPGVY